MSNINKKALEAIAALQRPGKPDLLGRVVALFKSESPAAIASIEEALDASDLETVRVSAHSLKSSSAYLGASALSERMANLERAATDGNHPGCLALGSDVRELFDEVIIDLDAEMNKAA